ncbi:hypothetical protein GCM10009692_24830 [Leucobacter aridicollis]
MQHAEERASVVAPPAVNWGRVERDRKRDAEHSPETDRPDPLPPRQASAERGGPSLRLRLRLSHIGLPTITENKQPAVYPGTGWQSSR